ncbi:MAG: Asp-tRNA(Asn)/Glu-tRNA(Gln) amidotransferase subunit GatA [Gemmatimonadota bacterium]|jgi:aspartyl-tRNA(Asn)/glutamyl-tRNA(Gln) amidotransferase subunit A
MRSPVAAIAEAVGHGGLRCEDTVARVLDAIRRRETGEDRLNAFLAIAGESALEAARAVDRRVAAGEPTGPLAGVPVAIKDNLCTLDLPTTCGSRLLEAYRAPYEATVVRRLREAGAIPVGKTNLDEFAMGSSTEYSAFGPSRNPHDRSRVAGGSSGGSAAAVAAGLVPAALGSDTGGSVRQPAAFCGVVGFKPTWGRVSRYGLVAFASSLDQVGTIASTVEDAALLLQTIAGPDPFDATAAPHPLPDLRAACGDGLDGLTVGALDDAELEGVDAGVLDRYRRALDAMRSAGARIRTVTLPASRQAISAYYVIAPAEASSNLARYDGIRFGARASVPPGGDVVEATRSAGFGPEAKRRIMLGTFVLSEGFHDRFYGRAIRAREAIARELAALFDGGVDALFTPTAPSPAFRIGEKVEDPLQMYRSDLFTVTANLAGVPAISLPVGRVDGLPVGGQFLAGAWNEAVLVRAAAALEGVLEG